MLTQIRQLSNMTFVVPLTGSPDEIKAGEQAYMDGQPMDGTRSDYWRRGWLRAWRDSSYALTTQVYGDCEAVL